ncbi:MAG: CmcJ/NvfI family oxidoreductase, partial [Stellaceae bacterium]
MADLAELDAVPDRIEATLDYFVDTAAMPVTLVAEPGGRDMRSGGGQGDQRRVSLRNGRLEADRFRLDREGFRFVRHDTKVASFYDEAEIRRVYYPEMENLVKAESGARRVVVFDHTLRTADDALREETKIRDVVRRVHNDYTEWSAPQRVRDILPEEAETLLARRFAIV